MLILHPLDTAWFIENTACPELNVDSQIYLGEDPVYMFAVIDVILTSPRSAALIVICDVFGAAGKGMRLLAARSPCAKVLATTFKTTD